MPSCVGLLAQLLDVVLGEARQRLAVVELELLQQRQAGVLRLLQPREHRPHRRHLDRVRGDVLAAHLLGVVVLLVDLDLVGERVTYGTSILTVRSRSASMNSLFCSRRYSGSFVWPRITSSMSVWANFFGLILCSWLAPEQVVEERHVELQHFDELDDAAVGDVEFAVEVERPRVAVAAVLGDLAVVDVAGQLGGVLVLLVLRLERADADAVLLARGSARLTRTSCTTLVQSPSYFCSRSLIHVPAERAEVAVDRRPGSRRRSRPSLSFASDVGAELAAGSGAAAPRSSGTRCTLVAVELVLAPAEACRAPRRRCASSARGPSSAAGRSCSWSCRPGRAAAARAARCRSPWRRS